MTQNEAFKSIVCRDDYECGLINVNWLIEFYPKLTGLYFFRINEINKWFKVLSGINWPCRRPAQCLLNQNSCFDSRLDKLSSQTRIQFIFNGIIYNSRTSRREWSHTGKQAVGIMKSFKHTSSSVAREITFINIKLTCGKNIKKYLYQAKEKWKLKAERSEMGDWVLLTAILN